MRIVLIVILTCATAMAQFSVTPFTRAKLLVPKGGGGDSLIIAYTGDTLKAFGLTHFDWGTGNFTFGQGSSFSLLGDSLRLYVSRLWLDKDSNATNPTMYFLGARAGVRFNTSTNKMQFSHDNSTWSDMGSGGGGGMTWRVQGGAASTDFQWWRNGAGITLSYGDSTTYDTVSVAATLGTDIALAEMQVNSVDSTKIVDAGIGSGDIGTGRITTTHILDNTVAWGDLATAVQDSVNDTNDYKAIELWTVGGQDHGVEDQFILSLEGFQKASNIFVLARDSCLGGSGTVADTFTLNGLIDKPCTQAESLIIIYQTTDGTLSNQKIDTLVLSVTTDEGTGAPAIQAIAWGGIELASATRARAAFSLASDADFNYNEIVTVRVVFQVLATHAGRRLNIFDARLKCK